MEETLRHELRSFRPHVNSSTSQFGRKSIRPHVRVNSLTCKSEFAHIYLKREMIIEKHLHTCKIKKVVRKNEK